MKKRLYIDFDGVVMDTIPVLYSALEKSGADLNNEREASIFFSTFDFRSIINDDNILNDSIECINKLVKSNMKINVSFSNKKDVLKVNSGDTVKIYIDELYTGESLPNHSVTCNYNIEINMSGV